MPTFFSLIPVARWVRKRKNALGVCRILSLGDFAGFWDLVALGLGGVWRPIVGVNGGESNGGKLDDEED